jgi:hypothetical protein
MAPGTNGERSSHPCLTEAALIVSNQGDEVRKVHVLFAPYSNHSKFWKHAGTNLNS